VVRSCFVVVNEDGHIVGRERVRARIAEFFYGSNFKDAGGVQELPHRGGRTAPVVIVAAGDDEDLNLARRRRRRLGERRSGYKQSEQQVSKHRWTPYSGRTSSRSGSK
jgi:hypothetical protein